MARSPRPGPYPPRSGRTCAPSAPTPGGSTPPAAGSTRRRSARSARSGNPGTPPAWRPAPTPATRNGSPARAGRGPSTSYPNRFPLSASPSGCAPGTTGPPGRPHPPRRRWPPAGSCAAGPRYRAPSTPEATRWPADAGGPRSVRCRSPDPRPPATAQASSWRSPARSECGTPPRPVSPRRHGPR